MTIYTTTEWKKLRKEIINKEVSCFICGSKENLHVHHKIRHKLGGSNEKSNLITLCASHHQKYHRLELFYLNNHAPKQPLYILNELWKKNEFSKMSML